MKRVAFLCALLLCSLITLDASPSYALGSLYGQKEHFTAIASMAAGKEDTLVLATGGTVKILSIKEDKVIKTITTGFEKVERVAFGNDVIYAFGSRAEMIEEVIRNRKVKRRGPAVVMCKTFSWDGAPLREMVLEGAQDITHARLLKGKLYIADPQASKLRVYDMSTGKASSTLGQNVRLCCGIFHFTVDPKSGDVFIPSLGAFRLQHYTADGTLKSEFGKRGNDAASFYGCCNPTNVEILSDGNLLIMQKEPASIRIYTPAGQLLSTVANVPDLNKGCHEMVMAMDTKGRLFVRMPAGGANGPGNGVHIQSFTPQGAK